MQSDQSKFWSKHLLYNVTFFGIFVFFISGFNILYIYIYMYMCLVKNCIALTIIIRVQRLQGVP